MHRILLLPFCLSREEQEELSRIADRHGYAVVVARSTGKALAEVRSRSGAGSREPVRIVGVVCAGRAKKVGAGLFRLTVRQWGKKALGRPTRRIELARVAVVGGTKSLFGRRECRVGLNVADREALLRALSGEDTFMRL